MKKKTVAVMCMMALLLTGCNSQFPDLSDEEAAAIGEYAAITLLKYDANGRSRLVDLSQVEEEPVLEVAPEPEQQPEQVVPEQSVEPEIQQPNQPVDNIENEMLAESIESFLELPEGMSVSYIGYDLCRSYQEDENTYFALEASEGKELLVARFVLQNDSGSTQEIDLLDRRDNYRLTVNETYTRTALTTLLSSDMSTYLGTVEAGASEELVLVIEIEQTEVEDVQSITLNLKNASKTYTIQLL